MTESRFADMISKIAHELRSPLTSVKGFSSTLVLRWDRFNDEQKREFVEAINKDAERMGRIVSEVLDLARVEAGRLELAPVDADLNAVTDKVVSTLASLPGAERVAVAIPAGLKVHADPQRLEHVLSNIIENAIKFSDEGEISIRARSSDGRVEIVVEDHGVGIEPERLPEVFSGPGPTGQKSTPSGTGLGLYLSRRLVEAHGGSIDAASTLGSGSTFKVVLPGGTE